MRVRLARRIHGLGQVAPVQGLPARFKQAPRGLIRALQGKAWLPASKRLQFRIGLVQLQRRLNLLYRLLLPGGPSNASDLLVRVAIRGRISSSRICRLRNVSRSSRAVEFGTPHPAPASHGMCRLRSA